MKKDPAQILKEQIEENNAAVWNMLSPFGRDIFFPKGILKQSAEAKDQGKSKYNATIGMAMENNEAMYLPLMKEWIPELGPNEIFPYAPVTGLVKLREQWREKMKRENPSLAGKNIGLPIVVAGLTHGLFIVLKMFTDQQDEVLLADMHWGNYDFMIKQHTGANLHIYHCFNESGQYNIESFKKELADICHKKGKAVVLLNFPNNPTGYSPTIAEGEALVATLRREAENGNNIVVICDDAYFRFFYQDTLTESLFGKLADCHERLLAIKIDGATKEAYSWGLRCAFITYGPGACRDYQKVWQALEEKTAGAIRSSVSNAAMLSQSLLLRALQSDNFEKQAEQKYQILKERALLAHEIVIDPKYKASWHSYPFNSGYFLCLKPIGVDAEVLRVYLLDKYGVGTISTKQNDLRVAFSGLDVKDIPQIFELIHQSIVELTK